jgi:hypothetical protein
MNREKLFEVIKFLGVVVGTALLIILFAFLYYAESGG